VLTATALIQAGADLLIMRHPKAIEKVNKYIDNLFIGE
jgi:CO dehydrogenase/acetyl-CoA synthase delta subunit